MARGYGKASSELRGFKSTGGRRRFDDDSDDAYDADKDAKAMGYSSYRDLEDQEGVDERVSAGEHFQRYLAFGDKIKATIDGLSPESTKLYKEYRKQATAAYNEAEEKAKTEWQAANPGKDYAGRARIGFVTKGLKAAESIIEKLPIKPGETPPEVLTAEKSYVYASNLDKDNIRSLVLARMAYEKDAFLRLKGHYKDTSISGNYLHIKNPWINNDNE